MKKQVFEGRINGVDYTDYEEFNKALKNYKPEDLHEVSSSFKYEETSEEKPTVAGRQVLEDKTYNPFEALDNLFEDVFTSFQKVQTPVQKAIEEPKDDFDPSVYVVKCNLDKLTGEDADDQMLDDYSALLKSKEEAFETLSQAHKEKVIDAIQKSLKEANHKLTLTESTISKIDAEYARKIEQLENERIDKLAVLDSSVSALNLQIDYYDTLSELCD